MVSRLEIVQKIYAYLRNSVNFQAFRSWIVEAQMELECEDNLAAKDAKALVWEVEGRFAEFLDGLVDEAALQKSLRDLMQLERSSTQAMVVTVADLISEFSFFGANPTSNSTPAIEPEFAGAIC